MMIKSSLTLLVLTCISISIFSSYSAVTQASAEWPPSQDHPSLILWPHGAPGSATTADPERNTTTSTDHLVADRPVIRLGDVSAPTITLYAAPPTRNSRTAVVVYPGGGYQLLAIDLEGTEVCSWLNSIAVNCILLKYRVPNTGPYPKSSEALQDAQRAMGIIRQHTASWNIDRDRIGVLGFSAGGYLAAAISTHYDERLYPLVDEADLISCKPDFAILIYPGYLALAEKNLEFNPAIQVTSAVPPTFLVQAEDDPVHIENVLDYFVALKGAGIPAELHIYAAGGHGYGLRRTDLPITVAKTC